jgi:diguanylate cyclase
MSATQLNTDSINIWKDKYFQLLNDHECQEKNRLESQNSFYRAVLRLVLTFSGLDKELDKELSNLRPTLKNGLSGHEAKQTLSSIVDTATIVAERSHASLIDLSVVETTDYLDIFLNSLTPPFQTNEKFSNLIKEYKKSESDKNKITLVKKLVKTIDLNFTQSVHASKLTHTDMGYLAKFLGQLMSWLPVPNEYETRSNEIYEKIESIKSVTDINHIFKRIAGLINDLHMDMENDLNELKNFLKNLMHRTHDINLHMKSIISSDEKDKISFGDFENDMDKNLKLINQGLDNSQDIQQIKNIVSSAVMTIEQSVMHYSDEKRKQHNFAELEIARLKSHIDQLSDDVVQLQKLVLDEQLEPSQDHLTGLLNRAAYEKELTLLFKSSKDKNENLCLCVIDIDRFNRVNDTYGHRAGDKVLQTVANLCRKNKRPRDKLARYDKDKFIILIPGVALNDGRGFLNHLRHEIEMCNFHYKGDSAPITISCGLSIKNKTDTEESLFSRADICLDLAKSSGRNQCKCETDLD